MYTLEKIARALDPVSWKRADENPYQAPEVTGVIYSLNAAKAVLPVIPPDYEGMVKEFHEAFGHPVGGKPALIDETRAINRAQWTRDELMEFAQAVGQGDLTEVYDAIGDAIYFLFGTAIEYGPGVIGAVFSAIHRSNMSKLGEDGKPIYREDGKVVKGPGYFEPTESIKAILDGAINA